MPAVFPSAPKGRKGEKEIGHSKLVFGAQSPEERECRRESEPLVPTVAFAPGHRDSSPLTNRNIVYKKRFVKCFVKKKFGIFFFYIFFPVFLGNATCCNARKSGIKSVWVKKKDLC